MQRVDFPALLLEQILQQARAAPDLEVCGLIAGYGGQAVRCIAIRNVADEPRRCFRMDARQQIDAFRHMREQGEQLFGIYHSHPDGSSEPSHTDIVEAGYPEALQFIISLAGKNGPQVCAYRLRDGVAAQVQLDIQPPAD